ncbi:hypothetical protein [Nonomuraea sp. MG754425]|nr:hypothetical protein [Nonomuraea sp. MG754425]
MRTASRAIARLKDLAVEQAGERAVEVAERLRARVPGLREVRVVEMGP